MKTIITLAIAALISATAARAEVITKGGASALLKAPAVKAGTPVAAVKCATCKSEFLTTKLVTFKGRVSGEELGKDPDMKPHTFTYQGQEVKLCCEGCLKDFNKEPAKYIKKIEAAQKK